MSACELAGIIILLAAMVFPWWYGDLEGKGDARKIFRNGTADSLKEKWHRNNALRRGLILAFSGVAHWLLLLYTLQFDFGFLGAYLAYSVAAFGYRFTTRLNTCRKLHPFYVSRDPRASYTDRFFVRMGTEFGMPPHSFSRLLHTVFLLAAIAFLAVFLWVKC